MEQKPVIIYTDDSQKVVLEEAIGDDIYLLAEFVKVNEEMMSIVLEHIYDDYDEEDIEIDDD